jgi:hypothetical protein
LPELLRDHFCVADAEKTHQEGQQAPTRAVLVVGASPARDRFRLR